MIRYFTILILAAVMNLDALGQSTRQSGLEGVWMSETYFDTLTATRSLLRAFNSIVAGIPYLKIFLSDSLLLVNWENDFHDGNGFAMSNIHMLDSLTYEFLEAGTTIIQKFTMKSDTVVQWSTNGSMEFLKLDRPLDFVINRLVIAGRYVDDAGKVYVFQDSGTAVWPNRTFKYRLSKDFVLFDSCDWFFDWSALHASEKLTKRYGFKWINSRLQIFCESPESPDGEQLHFEKLPFVTLRKVD